MKTTKKHAELSLVRKGERLLSLVLATLSTLIINVETTLLLKKQSKRKRVEGKRKRSNLLGKQKKKKKQVNVKLIET
ncbi:hypothetical protein BC941DRAFT_511137, partial [Chlamydoabsidia padenii]